MSAQAMGEGGGCGERKKDEGQARASVSHAHVRALVDNEASMQHALTMRQPSRKNLRSNDVETAAGERGLIPEKTWI